MTSCPIQSCIVPRDSRLRKDVQLDRRKGGSCCCLVLCTCRSPIAYCSRERNREHAKNTRIRKKNHVDTMVSRLDELRCEGHRLQQMLDERNTASILLKLGASGPIEFDYEYQFPTEQELFKEDLVETLRNSVYSEVTNFPGDLPPERTSSPQLSQDDSSFDSFEYKFGFDHENDLRKQRNRMHAKLSRDRRKLFAEKLSDAVQRLETQNSILSKRLDSYDDRRSRDFLSERVQMMVSCNHIIDA